MRAPLWAICGLVSPALASPPPAEPPTQELNAIEISAVEVDAVEIEEVEVVELRARETPAERTIDGATLSVIPAQSADDLLRLVPGLYTSRHGGEGKGYQIFLRGFDAVHGSDIEVRLAGIPLNGWSNVHGNGYLDLAFIVPEAVRAMRASKGPLRLDQGPFGTAGSVELSLGVARPRRGLRASYQIGDTGRHRGLVLWAPEDRPEADVIALEAMTDEGFGERRASERVSGLGQWRLWRKGGHTVTLMGAGYGARFQLPGAVRLDDVEAGRIDLYGAYPDDTAGASARGLLQLRHTATLDAGRVESMVYGHWRHLELDENFTGWLEDADASDRRLQRDTRWTGGAQVKVRKSIPAGVVFSGLIEGQSAHGPQSEHSVFEATPGASPDPDGRVLGDLWRRDRGALLRQHTLGVGGSARWLPVESLWLEGALRWQGFMVTTNDRALGQQGGASAGVWLPRLTGAWDLAPKWQVSWGLGRGVRPPEGVAAASGALSPVVAEHGELGGRWMPMDGLELGLTGFAVYIERESIFDHVSGLNVEQDATQRFGAEGEVHVHPWDNVEIVGDVALIDAQLSDGGEVPNAPTMLASFRLSAAPERGLQGALTATYVGERPLAYGAKAAAASVMDASIGWRGAWWSALLEVQNLLGAEWYEGANHFASWWDTSRARSQLPAVHVLPGSPRLVRLGMTAWW